ncbi:MAG: hypothetical protein P8N02_11340, partial [Actinomycetota bacterium]|nr:hypothetical protein [Actinomycetota bacterium]
TPRIRHAAVDHPRAIGRALERRGAAGRVQKSVAAHERARALARLEHSGLLHVLDTSTDDERFAVITEALPERHLGDELHARGHLPPAEAVGIALEVGEALAALHRAGFAHGGLELHRVGRRENQHVVILDGPPTSDAVKIPATPSEDLQSLAVLTHLLLVGHPPITAPDGRHDLHSAVPPPLVPVLQRALDDRDPWPDTTAFMLALRDILPSLPAATVEFDESPPSSFFAAERAWFAPVGVLLIVAAVILGIGIVIARTQVGQSIIDNAKEVVGFETTTSTSEPETTAFITRSTAPSSQLEIIDITDFDPAGDDRAEHPVRIPLINDGDSVGGWHTERYTTRNFGNLKEGVGLILTLGPPQQLDRLRIGSPSLDWSVEIYAADEPAGTVVDWGEPVAAQSGIRGAADISLDDVAASTVLIWITDLGEGISTGGHRVTVTDIEIEGRPLFG